MPRHALTLLALIVLAYLAACAPYTPRPLIGPESVVAVEAVADSEAIEPPILLHKQPVRYTKEAHRARLQGAIIAQLKIDERGIVRDVKILRDMDELSPTMGLTHNAIEALWKYRFEPAKLDGRKIAVLYNERVVFRWSDNPIF